jgi:hypothetical protein
MHLEYSQAHAALGKVLPSEGYGYMTFVMDFHKPTRLHGYLKLNKMPYIVISSIFSNKHAYIMLINISHKTPQILGDARKMKL